ncbi:unnamed protein product, partial [Dibothriocephalus latus]
MAAEDGLKINVKFNGKLFVVSHLSSEMTVLDVKKKLYELTRVPPENQKLLGLSAVSAKVVSDDLAIQYLNIKPSTKIMLIGSTEEAITIVKAADSVVPDSIDDFDLTEEDLETFQRPENLEKVQKRSGTYKFIQISEMRPGKRLLVLDIDYTIFDHLTPAESAKLLMRPYLYEMLTRAYVNYDIAIWSATSMTWILAKIGQMNLIPKSIIDTVRQQQVESRSLAQTPNSPSNIPHYETDLPFKICLLVDSGAMISVYLEEHGVKEVKPLAVIWNRFQQYGPQNTIMFDDVRRNFAMNPQSGLRIHSYRDAHVNYSTDKELLYLADYLDLIALLEPDFTKLNHHKWSSYVEKNRKHLPRKRRSPTEAPSTVRA